MSRLTVVLASSLGKKYLMAATGLMLAIFVLGHALGNTSIFWGRAALHGYAHHLHALGPLLRLVQFLLVTVFLLHIVTGLVLFLQNRAAQGATDVAQRRWQRAGVSRTMIYSGLALLAFLGLHLVHFVLAASDQPLADRVVGVLGHWSPGIFYLVAFAVLGLHLLHGLWSMLQTFGLSHPNYDGFLGSVCRGFALLIAGIFFAIGALLFCVPGYLA
ncbi:MAG: hypothetical protein BWK76_12265 [Desulfobulbaceae bacterium A2]|nr:MAG: hypothetical protein BWK76_12265 [Desulfobulbaceae bacterium A2]